MKQIETQTEKKSNVEVMALAINSLYEYAEKFYNYEMEHFNKFVGLDIFKVDGSIKQKYDHEKISFKGQLNDGTWVNVHYWFTSSYSFDMHVKICVNGGSYDDKPSTAFCQYHETTLQLFDIKDGKLSECGRDKEYLKTRYNVDELTELANKIREAANQYREIYDTMPHLFTDVFYLERLSRR